MSDAITLWRPVGAYELRLIAARGFRAYPPRLPEQPFFYPVCNHAYAVEIATRWNLDDPNSGFAGFVTRFAVPATLAARYPRRTVGAGHHQELWVPAAEQAALCDALLGLIEVTDGWLGPRFPELAPWPGDLGALSSDQLAAAVTLVAHGPLTGGPLTARP